MLASLEDAKVLAGGQSLIPLLNFRLARPAHLVDINRVAGLDRIYERDGGVAIQALARQATVEDSREADRLCPLLTAAVSSGHRRSASRESSTVACRARAWIAMPPSRS